MTVRKPRPVWLGVVFEVHDGDTATVLTRVSEQPYKVWVELDGRINGYNANELKDPGGPEARDYLTGEMPVGTKVEVTYFGNDKYGGRDLLGIKLPDGRDVAQMMISAGYGAAWNGRGAKPTAPWPIPTKEGK